MNGIGRLVAGPWVPPARGKAPYMWLLSLFFFAWKYLYVAPTVAEAWWLAATLVLFVPLYFWSYWTGGRERVLAVVLTCLFGVLWARENMGASSFFIFACAMCAGIGTQRQAYCAVAAVLGLAVVAAATQHDQSFAVAFVLPVLIVGTAVGLGTVMDTALLRSRHALLRKQEEVEHMATIAERERISRDLHDLLGHTLSLITLKAELAGKLLGRDAAACRQEIGDIERSARHALAEVRSAVSGYRLGGFAQELETARASLAAGGVALSAQVQPLVLPTAAENVMALALREAVTNIVRHAAASHCDVALVLERGAFVLRVADNGAALAAGGTIRHGNGLSGMNERVTALGGKLALRVERGLALELSVPMETST